ncbi:hypothetical protein SH591_12795 [Sphingomonas sp. LY54]|jgi:hypothetical protein|uniref:hypothetical protein n=1 Tax=Sphingomonadales TaxID=204457 RepID=UPI002ADEF965|nr:MULTISPECIES: hypothetical protein [Sphingomonadales]MEA1015570.1 hypothetical protein [Sphingosinicella sp. LY1275]WRP27975.1 hypothetical protein SH591_12795 [Sphingomonas sp. LY54]
MQAQLKKVYVQRPPRQWINVETIVEDGVGRQLDSRIWNISDGGFMAECEVKLPIGSEVVVELPGRGKVRAEIRWAVGWRFGAMILGEA